MSRWLFFLLFSLLNIQIVFSEPKSPDPLFDYQITYFRNQDGDALRKVVETNELSCKMLTVVQEKIHGRWQPIFTQNAKTCGSPD